jgi:hypothetical protein
VILRRTVGVKKDEFFLNRKRIQKSEVVSLLESAGFSKSNPYYIVQQGKVSNLCVMKDKDRLTTMLLVVLVLEIDLLQMPITGLNIVGRFVKWIRLIASANLKI